MASNLSLPSTLAWGWVIEALSSSNQVDTSLLIDIVKKAPEGSDDLGKNSREMVSLRILESLTVKGNQNNKNESPAVGQKRELDLSSNCEDVLRDILAEMSATDLKTIAPEMLNWDVESFIVHKRASLPMRALQKLKDAILEGSHSVLASLRERSGLSVRTQCCDNIPVNGGNSSGLGERLEECSRNSKDMLLKGNSSSPTPQNKDDELQENMPGENILPAKRNKAATTNEILEIQTCGDQTTLDGGCASHVQAANKFKQNIDFTGDIEAVVGHSEREGCNLEEEIQIRSSTPNRDDDFQGNSPGSNLLPAKRNRATTAAENLEKKTYKDQIPLGDDCDSHEEVAKKFKQDDISIVDNIAEDSGASPVHGLTTISSVGIVKHTEREGCNLEKEVQVGGLESNGSPHDDDSQHPALKRLAEGSDAIHDHLLRPLLVPIDDTEVAELSAEFNGQNNGVDEGNGHSEGFELRKSNVTSSGVGIMEKNTCLENPMHNSEGNFQENSSGSGVAKDHMLHNPDFDITSDSDDYHDERMAIALKKDAFLSSQSTYSQDSFATQATYCVKCNKEGQLLVCGSNTCQLVVHPSCLPSTANFDGNGKFYCPFCAYSQAISEYMLVKKKASFARKDLGTFLGTKSECESKKFSMRSSRAKRNRLRKYDDLCASDEGNNGEGLVNKVSNSHCTENMDKKHQAERPISCPGDHFLSGEKEVTLSDGTPNILVKGDLERKAIEQDYQSPRAQAEQLVVVQPAHRSDDDCREAHEIDRNEGNAGVRGKKVVEIPESALPQEPVCGPITESSEEDKEKPGKKYSTRSQKPMKQYTYPAIPQLRRKTIPWTKVEEEKLKEGVQRLSSAHDRSIPWTKILEFGGDVFQRGRTTIDLKDKWRNICKGGPR